MSHEFIDRSDDLFDAEPGLNFTASSSDDADAPQLSELLFDIGVAVAAYLTLGLVLDLLVIALHL
jgi:hypothetical protein